ncbi:MAG: 5-formyltetrahydrofolate cyclo-ligase [Candidatus Amulumruptor caecigallinarius]|nr:5-formyltetrahydrofolate cyclo-ligase [Candidatus Amulumruptor caecigallinarius]MCM1397208.1 5-formyltetrahydrofolate cyclo-ligase [Candidatus Amulumruptor caecigallinarius]MCM1453103.1 5-formyltetrahydrofolate cyclo-ligase [bacterium]
MDKDTIRSKIRATKALLTHSEKLTAAERVWRLLEQTAPFMMAERVLIYHSLADELDTRGFLRKWHSRKHFFLPRVNGVNLDILPFDADTLAEGAYRIMEPAAGSPVSIDSIDLVIVPGVAYDRHGNRVGRGKGFYDRLLADCRAAKVGIAYDFQLLDDDIDADPHDAPVDIIITERRYLRPSPPRRR